MPLLPLLHSEFSGTQPRYSPWNASQTQRTSSSPSNSRVSIQTSVSQTEHSRHPSGSQARPFSPVDRQVRLGGDLPPTPEAVEETDSPSAHRSKPSHIRKYSSTDRDMPKNWLQEIGENPPPRKPSISGDLRPFEIDPASSKKASRSQSFAEGTSHSATPRNGPSSLEELGEDPEASDFGSLLHQTMSAGVVGQSRRSQDYDVPRLGPASPTLDTSAGSTLPYGSMVPGYGNLRSNFGKFFVVTFKANRADVFTTSPQHPIHETLKLGHMVVVDGDRGWDLGQIAFITPQPKAAEDQAKIMNTAHLENLVVSSYGYRSHSPALKLHTSPDSPRLKYIHKVAAEQEIHNLRVKEHLEAKAKRLADSKVKERAISLEVLDTEYQADLQKCSVFYFAPFYVPFNDLVQELYKVLKVRIWMSNVTVNNSPTQQRAPQPMQSPTQQAFASPAGATGFNGGASRPNRGSLSLSPTTSRANPLYQSAAAGNFTPQSNAGLPSPMGQFYSGAHWNPYPGALPPPLQTAGAYGSYGLGSPVPASATQTQGYLRSPYPLEGQAPASAGAAMPSSFPMPSGTDPSRDASSFRPPNPWANPSPTLTRQQPQGHFVSGGSTLSSAFDSFGLGDTEDDEHERFSDEDQHGRR